LPNIKAAQKWARQSEKRTLRNKDAASRLKTLFKKAVANATDDAKGAISVESAFDKAASKGLIHKNKAARKKSRLAKAMKKASSAPAKPVKKTGAKSSAKAGAKKSTRKA
jgi:small subunit ribosomal protein S20